MKLGFGLYKALLNDQNFQFAKQAGASHLIVQLVDYVKGGDSPSLAIDYKDGWGVTQNQNKLWEYDELMRIKKRLNPMDLNGKPLRILTLPIGMIFCWMDRIRINNLKT